jgi:hypothetical protein
MADCRHPQRGANERNALAALTPSGRYRLASHMTTVSTVSAPAIPRRVSSAWRRERIFFTTLPVLMFTAVVIGFARTYYLKGMYGSPALSPLFHAHGLMFTTWMLLLIGQPLLVAARRTDIHRRIGPFGGLLAAAMTVIAIPVSIDLGRRGAAPPGVPPIVFLVVPVATVIVFPALVAAALYWRRNTAAHKRLMLIATMELIPAGFGRWPILAPYGPLGFFGGADLFLVAILAYDLATLRRPHPATVAGGLFLVGSQFGRFMIGSTDTWQSFAMWLIS